MEHERERLYWVDAAKAIGIFFVYYGHVLQHTSHFSPDEIFFQYKVIFASSVNSLL